MPRGCQRHSSGFACGLDQRRSPFSSCFHTVRFLSLPSELLIPRAAGPSRHGIDWDEESAFNNVPREDVALLPLGPCNQFATWAKEHYRRFHIRVDTPYGVSDPFPMLHGGAQGDSGGVGLFTLTSMVRTLAHRQIWGRQLDPRILTPLSNPPQLCRQPAAPADHLCEVVYSDDRRLFAVSAEGASPGCSCPLPGSRGGEGRCGGKVTGTTPKKGKGSQWEMAREPEIAGFLLFPPRKNGVL